MNTRFYLIDNLKIFLIFLVVLGHVIERTSDRNVIYNIIYIFHMPLFIALTGFTFKKYILNNNYKKIITKTLIPYGLFQVLYSLLTLNFNLRNIIFIPYYHLWFLLSLFSWTFMTSIIKKYNPKYSICFSIFISLLIGFLNFPGYFLSHSRTITYFPFFLLGFYFDFDYLNIILKFKKIIFITTFFALIILFFNILSFENELLWGHIKYHQIYSNQYVGFIKKCFLFFYSSLFSLFFLVVIPNKKFAISKYGTITFDIYIYHVIFIEGFKILFKYFNFYLDNQILQIFFSIFIILNCVLFSKIKSFILSQIYLPKKD